MANFKSAVTRGFDLANTILILYCIVGVPIFLLYTGLELSKGQNLTYVQSTWWRDLIIVLGALVILTRATTVLLSDIEELRDIKAELRFVFAHAKTAWSIGGGTACIVTGLYFLVPATNALHERFEGVFSIFISVIGVALAVHVLYRNMAPIVGTPRLLDSIIDDLHNCSDQSAIWLVYPALNFGFYRSLRNGESVWNHRNQVFDFRHRCGKFYRALRDALESKPLQAIAITYGKDKYLKLFDVYHKMIKDEKEKSSPVDYVRLCTKSAELLSNLFESSTSSNVRFEQFDADQFPQHVIIIGDVVYIIVSYGIPIYDKESDAFIPLEGENEPADVLTWRRKDAVLAKTISSHLNKLLETKNAKMTKSSN